MQVNITALFLGGKDWEIEVHHVIDHETQHLKYLFQTYSIPDSDLCLTYFFMDAEWNRFVLGENAGPWKPISIST